VKLCCLVSQHWQKIGSGQRRTRPGAIYSRSHSAGAISLQRFISVEAAASSGPYAGRRLPVVTAPQHRSSTPRRATWLILRRPEQPTPEEEHLLAQLTAQDAELAEAIALAQDFAQLVRQRQSDHLDPWLARAAERNK
jgi:transposase